VPRLVTITPNEYCSKSHTHTHSVLCEVIIQVSCRRKAGHTKCSAKTKDRKQEVVREDKDKR